MSISQGAREDRPTSRGQRASAPTGAFADTEQSDGASCDDGGSVETDNLPRPYDGTSDAPAQSNHDVDRLRGKCEYLSVHARNLERETRLLRREKRQLERRIHTLEHAMSYWRAQYEAIVHSVSWRAAWLVCTPYRAWLTMRRSGRS
jgi:hypothetical protein